MRCGRIAVIAVVAALSSPGIAFAQGDATAFDDASVRQYVRVALQNIESSQCKGGPCAPATKQELDNTSIPIADARTALFRGFVSAMGEVCDLDWQEKNFVPMMRYWRSGERSDREIAVLAMLHGIMQGQANEALAGTSCGSKTEVEAQLTFKP
jgi:hypothetical protein